MKSIPSGSITIAAGSISITTSEGTPLEAEKDNRYIANSILHEVICLDDIDFNNSVKRALEAIKAGIYPQLISEGSSGSYFVQDIDNEILAVFKPKDEEPFAPLNPKWPKYLQRILCFCCFGRACLIPNHGYLSEVGASIVDKHLGFFIVPKTRIIKLCSPTFYYGTSCTGKPIKPKPKEGSYQLFMKGYRSATDVLNEWSNTSLTSVELAQFTILFQKMCILDYVIRNTDRHMTNWLIRYVPNQELKIAAIDNGLAFPVKHPEQANVFGRQFPFNWATLSWAHKPWNEVLRVRLVEMLTPHFVFSLCKELEGLFRHDKTHNHLLIHSQMRVVRGQLWNLRESLLAKETPVQLVSREPLLVKRRHHGVPTSLEWTDWYKVKRPHRDSICCCA